MRLGHRGTDYSRKRTTNSGGPSGIYRYLLKALKITRPNQISAADITYVPMARGYMYLFSVIGYYSRKGLSWEFSYTLNNGFLPGRVAFGGRNFFPPPG